VYDQSHLGHARNYVSFDIIKRIMTDYFGYNVKLVMNITDLDDKIIRKSIEQNRDFAELARFYETSFLDDMRRLNVDLPESITRVSEFVPEIVAYIATIIENGYAYESNGSVYFDVTKFHNEPNHTYAKLEPTSATNKELRDEGEGVLTNVAESEKRGE
jgi:cysteinyl-tRNA synthetase